MNTQILPVIRQVFLIVALIGLSALASMSVQATTLKDIRPHTPTSAPWNEYWYYYINDPDGGYLKVTLHTLLEEGDALDGPLKGMVQIMHSPLGGTTKVYEYIVDEVQVEGTGTLFEPGFRFIVPGIGEMTEKMIQLTLPDISVTAQVTGDNLHYWKLNRGASPFSIIGALPFVDNKWFVYSLGTPVQYSLNTAEISRGGAGYAYMDKGWSTTQATHFAFYMAVSENSKLMLSAGSDEGLPVEMWAGRYLSDQNDITIFPTLEGLDVERTFDPCNGRMEFEWKGVGRALKVIAQADPSEFHDATVPSVEYFGSEYPSMKTANGQITVEVYKYGQLTERTEMPQGVVEFGGGWHCRAQ